MGRAAQAGRGVASAAKPRRAAALAGVGREGRLADAPSFMVKARRYHGSTGLRHVLPASCANGVNLLGHDAMPAQKSPGPPEPADVLLGHTSARVRPYQLRRKRVQKSPQKSPTGVLLKLGRKYAC